VKRNVGDGSSVEDRNSASAADLGPSCDQLNVERLIWASCAARSMNGWNGYGAHVCGIAR
jgi:hypothetical protein